MLDNCSARTIYYSSFNILNAVLLPPNMPSCLQPVDAANGRSFKCAFRRSLVEHILRYVDVQMEIAASIRPPFKINKEVSTYEAVSMMATAWSMVPTPVVLNGWLECRILAPFQEEELKKSNLIVERRWSLPNGLNYHHH